MCILPINKNDRVAIFIDNSNLEVSAELSHGYECIDYAGMIKELLAGRTCSFVHVHDSVRHRPDGSTTRLEDYFWNLGIDSYFRDSFDQENRTQKEVDVALAVDMVETAIGDQYDVAILVSGDRDFLPAVESVKRAGKTVELACFDGSTSVKLKQRCRRMWNLTEMPIIQFTSSVRIDTVEDQGGVSCE